MPQERNRWRSSTGLLFLSLLLAGCAKDSAMPSSMDALPASMDAFVPDAAGPLALNLVQYVNPFIGTDDSSAPNPVPGGAGGSTYPGAVVPFGMVQFSPDTPTASPSGYRYKDTSIVQFSVTHFDGAGCPNNTDIPLLPVTGNLPSSPGTHWKLYRSPYSKDTQAASPGYYKVKLDRYGISTELTATARTGFARLTYPATTSARLLVNTGLSATGTRDGSLTIVDDKQITGTVSAGGFCGSTKTFDIHFSITFDRSFTEFGTWLGDTISPGSRNTEGMPAGGYVTFDTTSNPVVQFKIALSYVSIPNAQMNLASENPDWDFAKVKTSAEAAWNQVLNRVQVMGGSDSDLTRFYTALYHVFQSPNVASDVNGDYWSFDDSMHNASDMTVYQNYSGWDIYRSWIQLISVVAPREATDIVKSMVLDGQQGGELPKWSQETNEDFIMTGDPGPIIVGSAYAFGVRSFDTAAALDLMNQVGSDPGANAQGNPIRGLLGTYSSLRYIPGNASDSLEYSASDFAIAQYAKALGDQTKYHFFMSRAQYWANTFNPVTGYPQARNGDGTWADAPLNPSSNSGFTEGNAAQYTWMIPYNLQSVIDLIGGATTTVQRLDHLFTEVNAGLGKPYFYIGNEPEFATPWAYSFAGAPFGTQAAARRVMQEVFTSDPGGLPGNDDLGATSSWYVWAALGLYPAIPGTDVLVLHGPLFSSERIDLGQGRVLQINGVGAGPASPYVQSLKVNGAASTRAWLHFSDVSGGATLDFTMGGAANRAWGSNPVDAPPSYTDDFVAPEPAPDLGANLALGKPATGSAPCSASETPDKAVDGVLMNDSKFCSLDGKKFLQIDLGASTMVGAIVIKHAGLGGESAALNTRDFEIQLSSDGMTWDTAVTVTGNTASRSVHAIHARMARYVKLNVITAENCCGNGAARIPEMEVYATGAGLNLTANKPVTGSMPCGAGEVANNAVDGSNGTKWCSLANPKFLQVDLGTLFSVDKLAIKHAGAGGETSNWNTKDFNLQLSTDGTNWTTPVTVQGNTSSVTTHSIPATSARYLRLNITAPEGCCGSGAARIYELQAYGQ